MNLTKNSGMLLLGLWLVLSGVIALFPVLYFNGLGAVMAILAIVAGILILVNR